MKKIILTIFALSLSVFAINAQTTALMGTTFFGGNGSGTIFTIPTGGNTITSLYNFSAAATGYIPESGVVRAPNGKFYGVFNNGGANGYGGIYEVTEGGTYTLKYSFIGGSDGGNPKAKLCLASDGLLYGTAYTGGAGFGTIFSYNPGASSVVTKYSFSNTDGSSPNTALIQASDGKLYGTVAGGGTNSNGVLFCYDFVAPSFNVLYNFTSATDGELPTELFEASNGKFYGLCGTMGPLGNGTIFSYEPIGQVFTTEYAFIASEGVGANCGFKEGAPGYLYGLSYTGGANGFGSVFEYYFPTNMYTNLVNFTNAADGGYPMGGLVKSTMNNKFYGTTNTGGSFNNGTVFEFDPVGPTFTTLADFTGPNGQNPKYVTLCEYTPLQASLNSTDDICFNSCNGAVNATTTGGTAPYTYLWMPNNIPTEDNTTMCAGTHTLTITDVNGTTVNYTVNINQPTQMFGADSGTDVTCYGFNNGTATTNPTGGVPPYSFLWSPSNQTTQTATSLGGGMHTVLITDANGCTINDFHSVYEPSSIMVNVSQTQVGCEGAMKNAAHANVAGGTPPYSYTWTTGGNTQDITDQDAIFVTVEVTDINSCPSVQGSTTLIENPSTDLTGAVLAPTLNIDNGLVYVFKSQPSINGIDTVAIVPIVAGAPNNYTFTSLFSGLYYLKVVPNAANFPTAVPTYFGDKFQWDSAVPVFHGCAVADAADINVIELNSGPAGSGFVSGFIIEGNGFQNLRVFNNGTHPNIPFAPGGPLKGIDVKLGKNPGGGIQARTMSDSTGYYHFDSIPDGNYTVYVDIPNLPMDSTRIVNITASTGDTTFIQNNYIADSLTIYVLDTMVAVGIYSHSSTIANTFNVYPNPSSSILNVSFELGDTKEAIIAITDVLGQVVYENKTSKESNTLYLDHLQTGVYYISVINGNTKASQRLVVVRK